ncbi:uracil-DNA glycosylase [Weeksellaceae bacterium KMM 9713]|uniref:Uracil-DNA glycosylase n=1 Tax=Profundicola chukchiensis TaxID=2961959 RepID=A0A9X4MZM3_9FLAO|nr:uracil-DNA glycosylase [Profundicola chukchiensis]MDG4945902.1 uracil-DNA glycosylase [Profundicola chukchiensis]
MEKQLSENWLNLLKSEIESDYFKQLKGFLEEEYQTKTIYPPYHQLFNAFNLEPQDIRVVILGQDPYHGEGQAHGYSFSVPEGIKIPKSLQNIYKELNSDLNTNQPNHGNLEHWVEQGVFLLNAALSVEEAKPLSHQNKGWLEFTDKVISIVSENCENVIFMLWGKFAQSKSALIDENKHLILTAPHPSPLSAYRGFFGCGHFSKANAYLEQNQKKPILW